MTLQEFRKHLQEIDKAAGANFFDNNVKRQNDREFTYDFDGHMDCQLIINKAGSVTELCEEYTRNFSSFGSWKQAMIEEFSR